MTFASAPQLQLNRSLILIIGDMETWVNQGRDIPRIEGYHFVDAEKLTPEFLHELAPEIILSSLVGANFDAIEISRKLGQMEFPGAYRVLTQDVPDVGLILSEVRNIAPLLDVDVIDLASIFPDR